MNKFARLLFAGVFFLFTITMTEGCATTPEDQQLFTEDSAVSAGNEEKSKEAKSVDSKAKDSKSKDATSSESTSSESTSGESQLKRRRVSRKRKNLLPL